MYKKLDGTGVGVVGGRVPGPGVGGLTLGGGYSWLTNSYGLTVDSVVSFDLVLPNGTLTTASSTTSDLFFALKGSLNRFGIVTSMVMKTVPLGQVNGGTTIYPLTETQAVIRACDEFYRTSKDPKVAIILAFNSGSTSGAALISFYNGGTRPKEFAAFDGIPHVYSSVRTSSYKDFVASIPSPLITGVRGAFGTISTSGYTETFIRAVSEESERYGALAAVNSGLSISYDLEPFTDFGQFTTPSAWPHDKSPLPLCVYFSWVLETSDGYWRNAMRESLGRLKQVAISEGIYLDGLYPNYALETTSGVELYGAVNAARLRALQNRFDPDGVMRLAGGFSF